MEYLMPAKRVLSVALTLLLAVSLAAPSGARAASADGFNYTLTGSDATVTGCTSTCPTTLVIPATLDGYSVITIGFRAFDSNSMTPEGDKLTTVTIPNSVTTIGDAAFADNNLTTVTIPNSVTSIGDSAFYSNNLTTVTIGSSVAIIDAWAFSSNDLTTVTIPDSVTSIGIDAFYSNNLTTVTIGSSVASIGNTAFSYNNLTTVTIPSSVTSIGIMAFEWNSLTSVTFLGNAPTAGTTVFLGNTDLASVTRPYAATGWGSTWSGVDVVTAADPTPSPTATPRPTATPTPAPSSTASPTPTPSLTTSPEPSASPDTGGVEPSPTDGDAAPWLIALLRLLASVIGAAVIRRRQREWRRK
jgi:hypothetical protein